MKITGPISPQEALRLYLQDHHAGASAGLALVRRAAAQQPDPDARRTLTQLTRDIKEDERTLRRVMDHVGAAPSPMKTTATKAAERLGRLKPNGQILGRSPLSSVVELEGLLGGVKVKQQLWVLLRETTSLPPEVADLDAMIERAQVQIDRLEDLWRAAGARAFPDGVRASTGAVTDPGDRR